ncbi:MAG: hypothetical protein F4126_08615 [Acidimicrobiaceae bacterium]|nr:hypothetical protein [Acidimicrobiaceae bacterium]MYH93768.1 hypothetical protein [Acidimicrobiaceae bacterium]
MVAEGPNWADKTVFTGDNLPIMRAMNSESVDLIYLDPPFNSKADYAAPIGSAAAGAAFKDTWTLSDVDVEWINLLEDKHPKLWRVLLAAMTPSDKSYLAYMAVRLLEMHRLLKPDGSLYLHCDPTMSHYLKLLLDAVFGRHPLRNEIIWHYRRWSGASKQFQRMHDVLLWYSRGESWTFTRPLQDYAHPEFIETTVREMRDGRLVRARDADGNYIRRKSKNEGVLMHDVWDDINFIAPTSKERVGYPTQKPLALLQRVITASSNPGDLVFDPFCGCATTLVAADDLTRSWTGIDISPKAAELVTHRITDRQGLFRDIIHRTDLPKRTDLGTPPPYNCTANRQHLYGTQSGNCAGCRTHFEARHLEVDHIIAAAKGGTDHIDNLQLLCGHCNRIKGDRGMEYLRTRLQLAD